MASSPSSFWQWFEENATRLRPALFGKDPAAREEAFEEIREALDEVKSEVILEFSSGETPDTYHVIVSADSRPERVDAVKELVASAPELRGWQVVAFRPRMDVGDSMEIVIGDEKVGPADVWFTVAEEENGLALTLYVRGLTPANERMRGLGAALLAEHAVGERDALTLLSSLRTEPLPEGPEAKGLRPFGDLLAVFAEQRQQRYPSPGALALDPEGSWQAMQGSLGGAVAFVMLNTGLQDVVGHPDYDCRLVITIPFNDVRDDGLPTSGAELDAVQKIGEQLAEALEEGQESLLGLTITSGGRREMNFYTSNADAALRRLQPLRRAVKSHRIETDVEWDTYWRTYRTFSQAGAEEEEAEE
jgi:hypothetical protein